MRSQLVLCAALAAAGIGALHAVPVLARPSGVVVTARSVVPQRLRASATDRGVRVTVNVANRGATVTSVTALARVPGEGDGPAATLDPQRAGSSLYTGTCLVPVVWEGRSPVRGSILVTVTTSDGLQTTRKVATIIIEPSGSTPPPPPPSS